MLLHHCNDGHSEVIAELERLHDARQHQALLCCKFRNYKRIAALYGHELAEQLIAAGLQHLQTTCPSDARLIRMDHATVAVILSCGHDPIWVEQLAHRGATQWPRPGSVDDPPLLLTLAIGVACSSPQPNLASEHLLRRAQLACQMAERRPGSQVVMASADLSTRQRSQYEREASLHRALEQGELTTHLQPIVNLRDGTPIGFECLARWRDGSGAVIRPIDFLDQAIDAGISADVDLQTLASALEAAPRLAAAHDHARPLLLSANISAQLVENPHKVEALLQLLEQHLHASPVQLQVELLEESLHEGDSAIDTLLNQLTRLGVLIAIDDFGTGYSSLSRVHNLAVHTIKVDRSFVQRIDDPDKPSNHLLTTLLAIGHDLKVDLTAEGIETETQRHWLSIHGCGHGQGFLFSEPLSLEHAIDYLRSGGR